MIVIGLALLICIVGALLYIVSGNPRVGEIGRIMFGIGLFALLCCGGNELVKILGTR